ncbi:hypothetical protein HPC49_13855 [Pyxidicoccus fallax]|uniref:Peptidoglycan binding-like domain-containing protein n=1 Tax=Pyxidicoccus fallax TaxID=394095 RepID=A0A848LCF9_9BACT|nr:peptidoglycan-binding domain-containing protein [Pyxidicoccus fallax]NMO15922.1 hypothetical protein [Pyxidicoccus fallax]NPC79318.1 hypothetical protein [Pyxidicoccus fallax]
MSTEGHPGGTVYVVRENEGISYVARRFGQSWTALWQHPSNAELRRKRENPEVLLAGDQVFIPPIAPRWQGCETGRLHTFRLKASPLLLVLTLKDRRGRPFAGRNYLVEVEQESFEGKTDAEGRLRQRVSPKATQARLTLWPETRGYPETLSWTLEISGLEPWDTVRGVQQRLNNLGFPCGTPTGQLDAPTRAALGDFQTRQGLASTGALDPDTCRALRDLHGA